MLVYWPQLPRMQEKEGGVVLGWSMSRQVLARRLFSMTPWVMLGASIILSVVVVGDWVPVWSGVDNREEPGSAPTLDSAPQPDAEIHSASRSSATSQDRNIVPWFGLLEPETRNAPPSPETIAISRRKLQLVGISTSTLPRESFALIRSENGEIKALKAGDVAESGVELAGLLPNAVILKAGDRWEKLHIGAPPGDVASNSAGSGSFRTNRVARKLQAGTAEISNPEIKGGMEARPDTSSRRNGNPNLSNRDVRVQMKALLEIAQQ